MVGYGTIEAAGSLPQKRRSNMVYAVGGLALAVIACAVVLVSNIPTNKQQVELEGTTLFGMRVRVQQLAEEKQELSAEDVQFLAQYDQCESCLAACDHYEENHCDSFEAKQACLWEDLLAGCTTCAAKGCQHVIEYMDTNEALNATYGDNEDAKAGAVFEMAWRDACSNAVDEFPKFQTCIHDATSVAHAEHCLKTWLHPLPANMLSLAKKIAKTVGPPQCEKSYTGHECEPAPKPEENEGTCPQGFMCMPDPTKCEECACSCNTPSDKLRNLEHCLTHAPNPHAGSFCLATFFSQLPPDFVETAIQAADEPAGTQEHYDQILASCGGDENGTLTVTKCLEQVEYCIRPIQGKAGTFPEDEGTYQHLCECFRNEEVLKSCGETPENATSCATAIQEHYVYHVHHKYCVDETEPACNFACQWPLPGFFGDVAKVAEEAIKQAGKAA